MVSYSTFPLAGSVEFRRPSNIPGLADPTITVEVKTERDPSFEVRLVPGETYEIKIVPGDEPLGPGMARASEVAPARFLTYTVPDVDTQVMHHGGATASEVAPRAEVVAPEDRVHAPEP